MRASYSAALRGGPSSSTSALHHGPSVTVARPFSETSSAAPEEPKESLRDPSHVPQTKRAETEVYVLTILTDRGLHERMTALRKKYFPPRLNKLAAHLTLFHALPGSVLESKIIPHLESVANATRPFEIHAGETFRLKKGIAVSVPDAKGGRAGRVLHDKLRDAWMKDGFLSDQDAGGCRLHYTIMNKVDEEDEVSRSFKELNGSWAGDKGNAQGLGLWRYDRGFWRFERRFQFSAA